MWHTLDVGAMWWRFTYYATPLWPDIVAPTWGWWGPTIMVGHIRYIPIREEWFLDEELFSFAADELKKESRGVVA